MGWGGVDELRLWRALEQLVDLARNVSMTSDIMEERRRYIYHYKHAPNHIVMSPTVYAALIKESTAFGGPFTMTAYTRDRMIFGMTIELADLPSGEFLVGESTDDR
jgi:hypothetical protein